MGCLELASLMLATSSLCLATLLDERYATPSTPPAERAAWLLFGAKPDRNSSTLFPRLRQKRATLGFPASVLNWQPGDVVQDYVDLERRLLVRSKIFKAGSEVDEWERDRFHTYEETAALMQRLATQHPNRLKLQVFGKTFQGRNMFVVKLSKNDGKERPIIFIDSLIHAREWMTGAVAVNLILAMVEDTPVTRAMLEAADWHINPIFNIDGYVETWTEGPHGKHQRFQRKNMNPRQTDECNVDKLGFPKGVGVDLNRNFPFHFHGGKEDPPCFDSFHGPRPFSEAETRAFRDYVGSIRDRLKVYLNLHAFGGLFLIPYNHVPGDSKDQPPNRATMTKLANRIVNAMTSQSGMDPFVIGSAHELVGYVAYGSASDWVKLSLGIPYSYALELRPLMKNVVKVDGDVGGGFAPPHELIPKQSDELFAGLRQLASDIHHCYTEPNPAECFEHKP